MRTRWKRLESQGELDNKAKSEKTRELLETSALIRYQVWILEENWGNVNLQTDEKAVVCCKIRFHLTSLAWFTRPPGNPTLLRMTEEKKECVGYNKFVALRGTS